MDREVMVLIKLNENLQRQSKYGIPPILHYGLVKDEKGEQAIYYITNRYAITLEEYLCKKTNLDGT